MTSTECSILPDIPLQSSHYRLSVVPVFVLYYNQCSFGYALLQSFSFYITFSSAFAKLRKKQHYGKQR